MRVLSVTFALEGHVTVDCVNEAVVEAIRRGRSLLKPSEELGAPNVSLVSHDGVLYGVVTAPATLSRARRKHLAHSPGDRF